MGLVVGWWWIVGGFARELVVGLVVGWRCSLVGPLVGWSFGRWLACQLAGWLVGWWMPGRTSTPNAGCCRGPLHFSHDFGNDFANDFGK